MQRRDADALVARIMNLSMHHSLAAVLLGVVWLLVRFMQRLLKILATHAAAAAAQDLSIRMVSGLCSMLPACRPAFTSQSQA